MLLKVLRTARAIKNKKARAKKTFWRRAAKNKKKYLVSARPNVSMRQQIQNWIDCQAVEGKEKHRREGKIFK